MKTRGRWAKLTLSVVFLLTGCKGFWDAPTNGGNGTKPVSGNIYVVNVQTAQIVGYAVNSSGNLVALPGSPYAVPGALLPSPAITISPNNGFLYVSTANGIYLYNIATNGSLTLGNSSGPISNDQAVSMQVDSTNSWLVNVSAAAPFVYAIPISPTAGTITSKTEQFASLPSATVHQVAISPDNSFLFVAMGTGGTATIPFTATNTNPIGAVSTIPVANTGGAAISVAVDPLGLLGQTAPRLFYIGETAAVSGSNSGGLRVFDFSTFKELSGSPMGTQGLAPYWILPKSSGDYLYVANRQTSAGSTGVITGFAVASSGSTYTLTQLGATFPAGTNPEAIVEDNTGAYIFAANYGGNPDLTGYTFSTTNVGYLVASISSATGTDPVLAAAIAAAH
jgi:6-phosphogluconolactonase (cycloisomerase 2 family)